MRFISQVAVLVTRPQFRSNENLLRLGAFLAVLGVVGLAILLREKIDLGQVGYAGVGLTALLASGGLVVPIPGLATACAAGALLNPNYVALVAGSAEAVGELSGYYLGYSGRGFLSQSRLYHRAEGWLLRHGWLALLLVSVIPNPIFDVLGIVAGALHYPLWRFLAVVWVGKLLKFLTLAYACAYSMEWLIDLFRV